MDWNGRMMDKRAGRTLPRLAIFSRRENHPLPYSFRQYPKLTTAPDRETAYGFGYHPIFSRRENMGVAVAGRLDLAKLAGWSARDMDWNGRKENEG